MKGFRARIGWWLFILAILVGVAARVVPASRPFDQRVTSAWRESDYVQVARNFNREGLNPAYPRIDWRGDTPGYVEMEFPFLPWAGGLLYRGFGEHVQFMRVLAALASLGALWLFYLLCGRLLSREAALYATAFFSINWMVAELGSALQPDGPMVFLSILTVHLTWSWWSAPSTTRLLIAALATSAAILAKAPAATLGLVLAYAVLARMGWRCLRTPAVYAAAALAIVPPLAWYSWAHQFWRVYGNSLGLSNESHLIGLDMLWPPTFLAGIIQQETLKVLTPFGWFALLAAVPVSRAGVRLVWVWLGAIWLFLLAAGRTTGDGWAFYYHALAVAPAYILVGAGIEHFLRRGSAAAGGASLRRWGPPLAHFIGFGTAASLLLAGLVHLHNLQAEWDGPLGDMYACAVEMTKSVPPEALIVTSGTLSVDDYGRPVAHDMPMLFAWMDRRGFSYASESLSVEHLDALAARGGRYWIATSEEEARIGGRGALGRRYRHVSDCRGDYSVFELRTWRDSEETHHSPTTSQTEKPRPLVRE